MIQSGKILKSQIRYQKSWESLMKRPTNGIYVIKHIITNLSNELLELNKFITKLTSTMIIFKHNNFIVTACLYDELIITCKHKFGKIWHAHIINPDNYTLHIGNIDHTIYILLKMMSDNINVANFNIMVETEDDIFITMNYDNRIMYLKLESGYGHDICKFLDVFSTIGNLANYHDGSKSDLCNYGLTHQYILTMERDLGVKFAINRSRRSNSGGIVDIFGSIVNIPLSHDKCIDIRPNIMNNEYFLFITIVNFK